MENLHLCKISSVEWNPSAVVALAASPDGLQVAAAREDGSLEVWLVSPGSFGWHCQLTIQGDPRLRVSSLVWCHLSSRSAGPGRLFSSSIDGSISEWDLYSLQQKVSLDSVGVSVWQLAVEPSNDLHKSEKMNSGYIANGHVNDDSTSESESSLNDDYDYNDSNELHTVPIGNSSHCLAAACDDGCVRLYSVSDKDGLTHNKSFPRVSGRMLSVAWNHNAELIFSGSSDGLIRCWDVASSHEMYRITVGLGGLGSGPELCVWSLLFLRSGTLVSGDSSGSIQFWDSHHGTLLQAHTYHKGDVSTLATVPGQDRVFSAGSDGQVILYKLSSDSLGFEKEEISKEQMAKWVYVGYVRAHTHDIRALAMTVPICKDPLPGERVLKVRRKQKPLSYSYEKWAHLGVPMLISGGDDTKLFAYSAKEFTRFSPHDICPAPQRPLVNLVHKSALDGSSVMLVQSSGWVDIFIVKLDCDVSTSMSFGKKASTQLLARFKSKESRKIISTAISNKGVFFAYSDNMRPSVFELKKRKDGKSIWSIDKIQLTKGLPCARSMIFTTDSSCLMLAGQDGKIYILDVIKSELIHTFIPQSKGENVNSSPSEPLITKMFTSSDGQWLAAVNCFGDIYIFNLEVYRQHWFISKLNDASITAGGFPPKNSSMFIVTTSSNEVYVLDVEAKQLGEWSRRYNYHLPRRFQEFPGEVIGLSFPPSSSTSVMIYSARAMCLIDFDMPVDQDDDDLPDGSAVPLVKANSGKNAIIKRKRGNLEQEARPKKKKNFNFVSCKEPVLFVGHLSENAVLVIEKQWMEVISKFDAPIHRHIFGT